MALSYPLNFPNLGITQIAFSAASAVAVAESPFTFARQVQVSAGQRWRAAVELPIMTRARAEVWNAFLLALNGQEGTFYMGDPYGASPRGSGSGTPLLVGQHSAGASTLSTDGWTASATGVLKVGDWIQLGTGLHKVVGQDVDANGSGAATVEIWPAIRSTLSDNTALILTNTKGIWRLESNASQLAAIGGPVDGGHYSLSFTALEAV